MLNPNFYLLIGAIESALAFMARYYRDMALGPTRPLFGDGPDAMDHEATGDPHLDPDPGKVSEAVVRLTKIKERLLLAEGDLSIALYAAQKEPDTVTADSMRGEAWHGFNTAVTGECFVFATVVRRLMWSEAAQTGAPEWDMMDQRLRRILTAFAEVGHGGGEDNPATNGPGILGSSNQSISY